MYDEKNRFHALSNVPGKRNDILQKGVRERLLCDECEQRFGKHEDYAARLLGGRSDARARAHGDVVSIEGVEYFHFKLFQMATLWRSGISTHPMFSNVSLGVHQERLRRMLLADDPGEPWQYGSLLFTIHLDGTPIPDLMVQPTLAKLDIHKIYRFVFGGMAWMTLVTSQKPAGYILENLLQENGHYLMRAKNIRQMNYLASAIQEFKDRGKFGPGLLAALTIRCRRDGPCRAAA